MWRISTPGAEFDVYEWLVLTWFEDGGKLTLERGTRRAQALLDKLQFTEARSLYGDLLRLSHGM